MAVYGNITKKYIIESGDDIEQLLNHIGNDHIWLSSDWHLYKHSDREAKYNKIISNYKSKVKESDVFIYCGDMSYRDADKKTLDKVKETFSSLPGTKILIKGNHDKYPEDFYYQCGFKYVFETSYNYKNIVFTHPPINMANYQKDIINIHGHIHDSRVYWESDGTKNINVFSGLFDDFPITLDYILKNKKKLVKDNVTSMYPNEKLDTYLKDEIDKYTKLFSKYLVKHPELINMTQEEGYKNAFDICKKCIKELNDPDLLIIKGEFTENQSAYKSVLYDDNKNISDYKCILIYNKDTFVAIDPLKLLCGKYVFAKAYYDVLQFKKTTLYKQDGSILISFDNREK